MKEQLMLEAEGLHHEAALLSNKLADFADNDVEGRRPLVEQILAIREAWKDVRYELQTGQKRREEKEAKPSTASQGLHPAEAKLELQKTRVNISKYEKKLREQPDHAKANIWQSELARLMAIKEEYEDELRTQTYEAQ
ncbi:hypothetical protein GO730_05890 [Spirosoma sp. HMF3257]|uniref:Uncharacterized protein n=1 Tax=Spirosoma telluris TaxID=2183553 RepID=A0A327NFR8_9BACT|nr:hypothetical protein [Spirosoma telluris]RAI74007.1 hypothetical protein HMF3257_05845 [Spirosoma telluris]